MGVTVALVLGNPVALSRLYRWYEPWLRSHPTDRKEWPEAVQPRSGAAAQPFEGVQMPGGTHCS